MITDALDGFIARKTKSCTRFGTTLDPIADKFFVCFAMSILLMEQRLTWFEAVCMLCRDFANISFALYLIVTKQWNTYRFRAIWCGKLSTFFQFIVLLSLTYGIIIPEYAYQLFILLGIAALGEFYFTGKFRRKIQASL
jgi:phosphatidylglycerophosphate synthase